MEKEEGAHSDIAVELSDQVNDLACDRFQKVCNWLLLNELVY